MAWSQIAQTASAFGPLLVSVLVAWIMWRQAKTARDKLRLDLFEKRYGVYVGFENLAKVVMGSGNVSQEALREYSLHTAPSEFLFDKDVIQYLEKVWKIALELQHVNAELPHTPVGDKRNHLAQRECEICIWFNEELRRAPSEVFGRDMSFAKIRG